MVKNLNISNYYNKQQQDFSKDGLKIKSTANDFIVQEINMKNEVAIIKPIVDLEKFLTAKELLNNLPKGLSKEERKDFYDKTRYYPLIDLKTENGEFVTEEKDVNYFSFTVMKIDMSHNDLIGALAKSLSLPYKSFSFSGTKDKTAITFQEIGVKVSFKKLFTLAHTLIGQFQDWKITELGYKTSINKINDKVKEILEYKTSINEINDKVNEMLGIEIPESNGSFYIFNIKKGSSLKLGQHSGNRFTIKIENAPLLKKPLRYFLNYFGPQRFGNNCNNHLIGEKFLEKDYEGGIDLIYDSDAVGMSNMTKIQKFIKAQKNRNRTAKSIFYSLNREQQMMFLHAYQSFNFNFDINKALNNDKDLKYFILNEKDQYEEVSDISKYNPDETFLDLHKGKSKFLKGGKRRFCEQIFNFKQEKINNYCVISFSLRKSAYATVVLREMFGDVILQ
ncbi:truD1 [Nucleospora cyclopteri]